MKKLSLLLIVMAITVGTLNLAAYAADFFTDENSFASWYADSAKNMEFNGVMNGYPDGSFQGENQVKRSELAVILDRFAEKVVGKKLHSEPTVCTLQFEAGLIIHLYDQQGNVVEGAKITASPNTEAFDYFDGQYSGLGEEKGHFTFKIEKEGYNPHIETIKLEQDSCHVIQQTRTITLIKKI